MLESRADCPLLVSRFRLATLVHDRIGHWRVWMGLVPSGETAAESATWASAVPECRESDEIRAGRPCVRVAQTFAGVPCEFSASLASPGDRYHGSVAVPPRARSERASAAPRRSPDCVHPSHPFHLTRPAARVPYPWSARRAIVAVLLPNRGRQARLRPPRRHGAERSHRALRVRHRPRRLHG